jgi:6-phosphogluconate dehydrogenase
MPGQMKLGIIELGKMGGNLALQAIEKNIMVVGKARGKKPELEEKGVKVVLDYKSFISYLGDPRVIYLSFFASWPHCRQYTRRAFAISATKRCSNG